MYLKILEGVFIVISVILALQLTLTGFGFTNKLSPMRASDFVSTIAIAILLYILSALILAIFIPAIHTKFLMVLFALSPFIIGKFATYNKINIYNTIQIICVIISSMYVLIL